MGSIRSPANKSLDTSGGSVRRRQKEKGKRKKKSRRPVNSTVGRHVLISRLRISSDMAKYILTRLKGNMRSASDVAPGTGSLPVKVTEHRAITRIAWVCGTDLHYVEGKHSAVVALLSSWGPLNCD